jgi:predicted esterase
MNELAQGGMPWATQRGRVVRGFRSRIDDSVQPYGLVLPEHHDFQKPAPLYVWLHGRGDKQTDMHFISERLARDGQIKPAGAIVLHPFGRHCLGFKSAGEIDVLEAIDHVQKHYRIDPDRIVLMGFSMGGAGAWHIGAHYTDRFVAISAGAGFVETARYTRLKPEDYPPEYEQILWRVYDVPNYTRNLFNRPVIAYSGELDRQIQAARVMEEAFREHGKTLSHIIGPNTEHKYHPDSLVQLLDQLAKAVEAGRPKLPVQVSLQTRTLRYNRMDWVQALRLREHWSDSRIDAKLMGESRIAIDTKNVDALRLSLSWQRLQRAEITIDGEKLHVIPALVMTWI